MTFAALFALLSATLGLAGAQAMQDMPQVRTVVIRDEVIMRVPVRPRFMQQPPWQWIEKGGPKCISSQEIRGAALAGPNHIDFLMLDRRRFRAELADDCPALDFYGGFYLNPEDDRICAGRDTIRSRMGGVCGIDRFRRMVRKPRR